MIHQVCTSQSSLFGTELYVLPPKQTNNYRALIIKIRAAL